MQLEVHFTPKASDREIPFTVSGSTETEYVLYSNAQDGDYKYKLLNDNGLFRLVEPNPFQESDEVVSERLVGISTDWIESRAQGFESSSEIFFSTKPGYGPDDIFVENKPFSLKQVVDLIDEGDIELTPDFQRNFIWDKTRQSKLIESILLGLPLPSIYLSQYEDGRLTVVDGLQRLMTIKRFMNDELILTNLEYLEICNGFNYSQLATVLTPLRMRRFGQTQVMCFVIDYRSPSQLKFDLFRRLNTGGKPLNNQEIRNCLSRPQIQKVLKEMVELESFWEATDESVSDARMEAREAALRYIFFLEQYSEGNPVGTYNGAMETSLDEFIDVLNKRSEEGLRYFVDSFEIAMRNAFVLFGTNAFRKMLPDNINHRRTPVNKLMLLTLSILLTKYEPNSFAKVVKENGIDGIYPLAELIENDRELFNALTYSTNSKWNVEYAFKKFKIFLDALLGTSVELRNLRNTQTIRVHKIKVRHADLIKLHSDEDRRKYVWQNSGFPVVPTRLNEIELRIILPKLNKPIGLMLYYFKEPMAYQTDPISLPLSEIKDNQIIVRPKESEFWNNEPFMLTRLGVLGYKGSDKDFEIEVELANRT